MNSEYHGITLKSSLLTKTFPNIVRVPPFRLTNQKLVFPRTLAAQPIKCYFANPISRKEIGGARTRPFCHSVTAWELTHV